MIRGLIAMPILGALLTNSISGRFELAPVVVFTLVGVPLYVVGTLLSGAILELVAVARFGPAAERFGQMSALGIPDRAAAAELNARARSDAVFMTIKGALLLIKWWLVLALGLMAAL